MVRLKSRWRVHLRTAAIHFTLTAAFTLGIAASPAIAQQVLPAGPQQQIPQTESVTQPQVAQPPGPAPAQVLPEAPLVGTAPSAAVAEPALGAIPVITTVSISQVVGCQESHCGHVIDLLIRNRLREQTGAPGAELAPGLILSAPPSVTQFGDLELLSVNFVSDGSSGQGPVIQLEIRNNSTIAVGDFQISIVGVLGQIHAHSPAMRGTVSQVLAGSVAQFQLHLPASAMAMGLPGQQPGPFDTLVVAIDSFDELVEANELNNVRIIRRVELLPMAASQAPAPAVVQEVPATAPPADTAIPSPAQPASPLDSLLLEDGQLETTQPTATGMTEYFRGTAL